MLYEFEGKSPIIDSSAYVSESAELIGDVVVGKNVYIGPGAVIRADARPIIIGDESAIEDLCVVHVGGTSKGCFIGKRVTVGHGAIIHADRLDDGANIGMGAVVSMYAEVGEFSVVAEGAVVRKGQKIPPRVVVAGSPATVKRAIADKDIYLWEASKQHYIDLAKACKSGKIKRIV